MTAKDHSNSIIIDNEVFDSVEAARKVAEDHETIEHYEVFEDSAIRAKRLLEYGDYDGLEEMWIGCNFTR